MLFNSHVFLFAFLPLVWGGYQGILHLPLIGPKKNIISQCFLIAMSLVFYGYFHPIYLLILCGSILVNYGLSRRIDKKKGRLILGIILNVSVIFFFKYYDFFAQNINRAFGARLTLLHILLPLGISFFTFQQISFLVDSYRGETRDYRFVEYALFVTFFPQLIAGPIVLHSEMIPQFRDESRRKVSAEYMATGLYIFAVGLFKKVILADTLACAVDWGFSLAAVQLTSMEMLIISLAYTFQLYFDFSGYCDMARGIARMFHFDLPSNFNSPYKAKSILEFWERWHQTLTRFLRNYIYIPLGGNRKGKWRTYCNILVVFLVSGIWHGANWTFIVWGLMHGVAQCINRMFRKNWERVITVVRWLCTFLFVDLAWILFRADSLGDGFARIRRIFAFSSFKISPELSNKFVRYEFELFQGKLFVGNDLFALIVMGGILIICFLIVLLGKNMSELKFKPTISRSLATVVMMVWSVLALTQVSSFLYFNF